MRASVASSWCTTSWMPSSSGDQVRVGDDAGDLDDHVVLRRRGRSSRDRSRRGGLRVRRAASSTARYRVTVVDCAAGEHSRRRLATRSRAPAHEQRRPVHGRARDRDVRRAACGGRSTSPSGSGTPSCASSASASPSRTPRCSTSRTGSRSRSGSPVVAPTSRSAASTAGPTIPSAPREPAVVWEGEEGEVRTLTYVELRTLTDRIASGLAARGVAAGDAVGLFLPMVPETVAAVFAVAKLGARFLPIFSGYGAEAVAIRLEDGGAVALVTADGFTRRGRVVPMKETADAAVAQVPSVHTVVVVPRLGRTDVPMQTGRDLTLDRTGGTRRRSLRRARGRQRAAAVRRVHERHDRAAEGRGPRPRRLPREDRGGGRVPDGPAPRRAAVLAHRPRLDHGAVGDRRHARQRRDARALRRRARPPRARPALVVRRAPPGLDPRRRRPRWCGR